MKSVRTSQLPYISWQFDSRYCGSTAESVIAKFKTAAFPKTQFPPDLLGRKVEEIAAMAQKMKIKRAVEAMQLLNDKQFHNDTNQVK